MDELELTQARSNMIEVQLKQRGIRDQRVLAAMNTVPREAFVPANRRADAYADSAWPIAHGQTISQPYMVARTIELARIAPGDRVLDIGLGSGYQAAVLARLGANVISMELVAELAQHASETLARIGETRVEIHIGDGSLGYVPGAPYDAIVVAAGAPDLPRALVDQLAIGGRLVIPVGTSTMQTLTLVERTANGALTTEHEACVYVPLRGAAGWSNEAL